MIEHRRILARVAARLVFALAVLCVSTANIGAQDGLVEHSALSESDVVRRDVETSDYYELLAWAERLGLSTRGTRTDLVSRLFAHYGIPRDTAAPTQPARRITIDTAKEAEYFTIEELDEQNVRVRGGVRITMEDTETGAVHTIEADEVTFNQTEELLVAHGDIVYTISRATGSEFFYGEGLAFRLDTWDGVFIDGVSERDRRIEEEDLTFLFSGRYITRSREDVIVLESGTITSSRAVPPYYSIRAGKIWILGPGEWGLENAILYVGRVPVLYFPFFFRPGDRLFFNPSLGYRLRDGYYIQTTTYLLGRPDESRSPFSFLQIAEEARAGGRREIVGLYVRETDEPAEDPKGVLKVLADIYTNLGAFVAIEGSFEGVGPVTTLGFRSGLAATRHVYETAAGYTTRRVDGDVIHPSSWNSAWFLGTELPFRYDIDLTFQLVYDALRVRGTFEALSDPYMRRDFSDRAEDIDWTSVFSPAETTTAEKTTATWSIASSFMPRALGLSPYVQTFGVSTLDASFRFRSRTIPADRLDATVLQADRSPEARFFYPDILVAPDIAVRIAGTPISSQYETRPASAARPPDDEHPDLDDFRPPWSTPDDEVDDEQPDRPFRLPPVFGRLADPSPAPGITYSVTYDATPRVVVENLTDSSEWRHPEDISLNFLYGTLTSRNTGRIGVQWAARGNLVSVRNTVNIAAQYRTLINDDNLEQTERETRTEQSYRFSSANIRNDLSLTSFFVTADRFDRTNVSYGLDTLLYQRAFDSFRFAGEPVFIDDFFKWEPEYIRSHSLGLNLSARFFDAEQTLQVRSDLPPLSSRYTGSTRWITGPVTSSVQASIARDEEALEWIPGPVTLAQEIRLGPMIRINENLVYNTADREFRSSRTRITAGPFSSTFDMQNSARYEFRSPDDGGPEIGWIVTDDTAFRPSGIGATVRYNRTFDPFWKNRVTFRFETGADWQMNLLRFTESRFDFTLALTLGIHEFLDLTFSSRSRNSVTYQYIPRLADTVGVRQRNVAADLLRSFNFFNEQDRIDSPFNLQDLSVRATHYLADWDLSITYRGSPQRRVLSVDGEPERPVLKWVGTFTAFLIWRPIPELRTRARYDEDGFDFDTERP